MSAEWWRCLEDNAASMIFVGFGCIATLTLSGLVDTNLLLTGVAIGVLAALSNAAALLNWNSAQVVSVILLMALSAAIVVLYESMSLPLMLVNIFAGTMFVLGFTAWLTQRYM